MDNKLVSEYALALDLLAKIAQFDTEEETVEKIRELFTILFAPNKVFYIPVKAEGHDPVSASVLSTEDYAQWGSFVPRADQKYRWTASGSGFMVKFTHKGNLLGVMVTDEVSCPEYKKHYLNLCLSIADVCGLAIENARRFQQLKNNEIRLRHEKQKAEEALAKVKQLSGLLPICSFCKKIRDDKGYWKQIETYIRDHSEADFSHSVCKECAEKHYPGIPLYKD